MQPTDFLAGLKQIIREEIERKEEGPILISAHKVAEKLAISTDYLVKHIMHRHDFPKPVRLKEKGDLKFYKHEIDEFILRLGGRI